MNTYPEDATPQRAELTERLDATRAELTLVMEGLAELEATAPLGYVLVPADVWAMLLCFLHGYEDGTAPKPLAVLWDRLPELAVLDNL